LPHLDEIKNIIHESNLTRLDKVLLALSILNPPASPTDIKDTLLSVGVREAKNWNISDILSKSKGLAIKLPNGWEPTPRGQENLRKLIPLKSAPKSLKKSAKPTSDTPSPGGAQSLPDRRKVFVIHGRDESVRKAFFDFLRAIGLHPLEWDEAIKLTGTAAPFIGNVLTIAFEHAQAIVALFTGDDEARLRPDLSKLAGEPEELPTPQPRPNVILEAGLALGSHPARTLFVEFGKLRHISDLAGRHAIRFQNNTKVRQAIAERLRTAGCDVNTAGTDWHEAGDFDSPQLKP
jgi:predicted nucleotide-binding protein